MLVPITALDDALKIFQDELEIYPIWLCPMKIFSSPHRGFIKPLDNDEMFVDIGAYGVPKNKTWSARTTLRKIEKFVRDEKGYQALYADTYMTREEFYQMFDHTLYNQLRKKYACDKAFPEVYDKISKEARA